MKLAKQLNPKYLFGSKKSRSPSSSSSVSRSLDPTSFSSSSSTSSDGTNPKAGSTTPNTVLPTSECTDFSSYELVQAFNLIDKDGDGKITRSELETLLSRIGSDPLTDDEITTMLTDVDHDGDGCISLEKFGAITPAFGPAHGSELHDAFDIFDADRDGKISAEELLGVFMAIGDDQCTLEDCRRMIGGVDSDGDGYVCFEDFSKMMEQQQQQQQRI